MLHHMTTILVCYGGHFELKMAAKIQKSSDLGKICFPSSLCSCELIIVIVFGIGNHIMILQIISYLVIIILLLSFFRQTFVWHISRRCLDQTLWNLVGISYAMSSCAFNGWFFQNGCRCHGNCQNAKKIKNTKMIIAEIDESW
jgi:hypothetical protein